MTTFLFTTLFLVVLLLGTLTKLWLARRQLRHVMGRRDAVPAAFREKVDLASHQKAADYTCAKTRLSLLSIVFEAALLLAFTLGGGIQLLNDWSLATFDNTLLQGLSIIVSALLISS
ncbi:MAG: M48 family peptidase, partial [Gallionellaceae bacterium]